MNIFCRHIFLLLLFLVTFLAGVSQKKYEREYSLSKSKVPAPALEFVQQAFKTSRIHWYGEQSLTGQSIEAKLREGGRHYSVEFDSAGQLQDIEILVKYRALPEKVVKTIEAVLKKEFSSHGVTKTQVQWSGSKEALLNAIRDQKPYTANSPAIKGITTRYELVVRGRNSGSEKYYELLFSDEGKLLRIDEIIQRNTDNMIF